MNEHNHQPCKIHDDHDCSLISEITHHIPYAIFSVAFGFIVLSFVDFFSVSYKNPHLLFHSFHFLHLIFATTGSLITFSRFSNNLIKGIIVSLFSSVFFCTLSDVVLPYLAGTMLGVTMHFHWCFLSELTNVVPLLLIGVVNGAVMSRHNPSAKNVYSLGSHFGHILISSLASLFYLVSEGFTHWCSHMGIIFAFLIVAVVIPCTFADVIVPVFFAQSRNK